MRSKTISRADAVRLISSESAVARVPSLARLREDYLEIKRRLTSTCGGGCDDSDPEFTKVGDRALSHISSMGKGDLDQLKSYLVCDSIYIYSQPPGGGKPRKVQL